MTNLPHFERMWISLPGMLREKLRNGEILTTLHPTVKFTIAYSDSTDATERAMRLADFDPWHVPGYLILLHDEHLTDLTINPGRRVRPYVLDRHGAAVGQIACDGGEFFGMPSEHGNIGVQATLLSEIRSGDFFCVSDRDENNYMRVYRALEDFDYRRDRVEFRPTSPGSLAGPPPDESQPWFSGKNLLVYRVTLPSAIEHLSALPHLQAGS